MNTQMQGSGVFLSTELLEGETCTAESASSSEADSSGVIKTLSAEHSRSV